MRSFVVMRQEIFNIFPRETVHFQRIILLTEVTMVTVSKLADTAKLSNIISLRVYCHVI